MRFRKAFIPYGGYWSTPFCKWQGSLSTVNSLELAGRAASTALAARGIPADGLDAVVVGTTVPQKHSMYAGPWVAALTGADGVTGTLVSQACATGPAAAAAHGFLRNAPHVRSLSKASARDGRITAGRLRARVQEGRLVPIDRLRGRIMPPRHLTGRTRRGPCGRACVRIAERAG